MAKIAYLYVSRYLMKMKLYFLFLLLLCAQLRSHAQGVYDGIPNDSVTITFRSGIPSFVVPDSATVPLWQIGHGHKTFFGNDSLAQTMMTDTTQLYPKNANNFFIVRVFFTYNMIIDFWHKYQTDTGHAGGIVEFSLNKGLTWQNVKGDCNSDSFLYQPGVVTENFYKFSDTLLTGEPAFSGVRDSVLCSRIQFYAGPPEKMTKRMYCSLSVDSMYIRFRFESDTATDTLAGWEIDSIKIERDQYSGGLAHTVKNNNVLEIVPNPSYGLFHFPVIENEKNYKITVYNAIGTQILAVPYLHSLDLRGYSKGLYFYKVSDGTEYYSGQLQKE